jgi:hypothetical protein
MEGSDEMNHDEIEAAAERFELYEAGVPMKAIYGDDMTKWTESFSEDTKTLARAYVDRESADRAKRERAVPTRDAINLLAEAACDLPPHWSITIHLTADEVSMDLCDPYGTDVEHDSGGECSFMDAIEYANEVKLEGGAT